MNNEVLRLKNDVLNELRNEKYYSQDELRVIVDDQFLTQREKVNTVIDIVSNLVNIDAKIATVEAIFQAPAAVHNSPPMGAGVPVGQDEITPTNIVEEVSLNAQGQTHSE